MIIELRDAIGAHKPGLRTMPWTVGDLMLAVVTAGHPLQARNPLAVGPLAMGSIEQRELVTQMQLWHLYLQQGASGPELTPYFWSLPDSDRDHLMYRLGMAGAKLVAEHFGGMTVVQHWETVRDQVTTWVPKYPKQKRPDLIGWNPRTGRWAITEAKGTAHHTLDGRQKRVLRAAKRQTGSVWWLGPMRTTASIPAPAGGYIGMRLATMTIGGGTGVSVHVVDPPVGGEWWRGLLAPLMGQFGRRRLLVDVDRLLVDHYAFAVALDRAGTETARLRVDDGDFELFYLPDGWRIGLYRPVLDVLRSWNGATGPREGATTIRAAAVLITEALEGMPSLRARLAPQQAVNAAGILMVPPQR